ncbi:MAG: glutathione S-transferase, partial [Comamonadaceae bacterium]
MRLALHGFPISNYYNKVKLALLEKGIAFDEVPTRTGSTDEAVLAASPLAKIPFLKLEDGRSLCESQVILDWLEAAYPSPLLPADPYEAAKVRELCTYIDWH